MDFYTTELGHDGRGRGVNRSPESAIKYTHDIFLRAAREHLDVYMLCGSLCGELRDEIYSRVVDHTFSDSVREVLKAGANVSIFVWGDPRKDGISSSFAQLLKETCEAPAGWGKLDVRASGTRAGGDEITHFIVARRRDDSRWIVRIEQPHAQITEEQMKEQSFLVPAVIFFDNQDAQPQGEKLLKAFAELFEAAGKRAQSTVTPARLPSSAI